MPSVHVTRRSTKSIDALWKVLDDFPNIASWFSGVKHSHSTSTDDTGVGAARHCDLAPIGSLEERIAAYDAGRSMRVEVFEVNGPPVKQATAEFTLREEAGQAILAVDYEFELKGGAIGRAVAPRLERGFEKTWTKFLAEWDAAA